MTPRELLARCLRGPYVVDPGSNVIRQATAERGYVGETRYPEEAEMFAAARTGWEAALDAFDAVVRKLSDSCDEVTRLQSRVQELEHDRDRFRQLAEQAAERSGIDSTRRIKAEASELDQSKALAREVDARARLETMLDAWVKYRHAPTLLNAYDVYKKGVS